MKWKFGMVLLALMLTVLPAAAKGRFTHVIITGETLEQPIIVTDPLTLNFLSLSVLEDFRAAEQLEMPADAAEVGYDLERQWEDGSGTMVTFDNVRYHPNVHPAESGYIYMAGTKIGLSSYDEKWFPATAEGDAAMRAVLAGEPVACPVTPTEDHAGTPLLNSTPNSESIWLTPPEVTLADSAAVEQMPNMSGSILLGDTVSGTLWMDITWLEGASHAPVRFSGTTNWRENLELKQIDRTAGAETTYDWEAIFAEPGCYSVYVWAGDEWVTAYVELPEGE